MAIHALPATYKDLNEAWQAGDVKAIMEGVYQAKTVSPDGIVGIEEIIEAARTAATAGRLDDARLAYRRAVDASPDSAFLHRELGIVERKLGAAAEPAQRSVL